MPNDRMIGTINAVSSFLGGYQKEQEKLKEGKRVESTRKKMEDALNSGDFLPSFSNDGTVTLKAITSQQKAAGQKALQEQQLRGAVKKKLDAAGGDMSVLAPEELYILTGYKAPPANQFSIMNQIPGFGNIGTNNQQRPGNAKPQYNPKSQKLQQNPDTGAYRVVPR